MKPLVLVINLDQDTERLESSVNQCKKLGLDMIRIEAVSAESLPQKSGFPFRNATEACWASHLKALRQLVESVNGYALIFEDDFAIQDFDKFSEVINTLDELDFDLVQLGFLNIGIINRLTKFLENIETRLVRAFVLLGELRVPYFKKNLGRMRIQLVQQTPKGFVPNSFLPGSHAYVISRNLAKLILRDHTYFLLPVDGFYNAISSAGGICSFRFSSSLVGQVTYPNRMRTSKAVK